VANFTWSCSGLTCTLNGSSSTDDGQIVSYNWNLGKSPDPTAAGQVVSATYPHEGNRVVVLTVTDNAGNSSSVTKTIVVGGAAAPPPPPPPNAPPVGNFTWSCGGLTCKLDASASTDDVQIVSYTWNLGRSPDPTASGKVVSASYPHSGNRVVTLTVTDGAGLTSTITKTITL